MRSLSELTFAQRIVLTMIIVLVILFSLAFVGWIGGEWTEMP